MGIKLPENGADEEASKVVELLVKQVFTKLFPPPPEFVNSIFSVPSGALILIVKSDKYEWFKLIQTDAKPKLVVSIVFVGSDTLN
jgi:hypothetical protein